MSPVMSFFKWSTPERRVGDRILPVVPNEIYLHILDLVLPAVEGPLPKKTLNALTRLSIVCRLFANVCLPRIFEHVEFSGDIFRLDRPFRPHNDDSWKVSPGRTLCEQIDIGQPLALSLAQCVKSCHFMDWELGRIGTPVVREFSREFTVGMTHMKNVRQVEFSRSFVDMGHWQALASLPALEELSFERCRFFRGPADLEPANRARVRVPHLKVRGSTFAVGDRQAAAAADPRFLHSVTMDMNSPIFDYVTPQSSFKELHLHGIPPCYFGGRLRAILRKVPQSLEVLSFPVPTMDERLHPELFPDDLWDNSPHLCSLAMSFRFHSKVPTLADIVPYVLESTKRVKSLQSLTISTNIAPTDISATELRDILRNSKQLEATPSLRRLDIYGLVFRLVDGEWTQESAL